jgi:phosphoesterase RecJ-like protein
VKRTGELAGRIGELPLLINLDHHVPREPWGDVIWIDQQAPAVGAMVLELARLLKARIGPEAALNLYTAIMTDTGRFQHGNTDAATLAAAAELTRLGADPALAAREVYQTYTEGRLRLLARALGTLELHQGGLVAFLTLRRIDFRETGTTLVDMDNFVDYARGVKGVEVAATLREEEDGFKISLRSTGKVDVARLASAFGGGGHRMAAGAFVNGSLDQVRTRVVEGVKASLAGGRDG